MFDFRSSKKVVVFALCLFVMVVMTACQKKDARLSGEGEVYQCSDIQFSASSGIPLDRNQIDAVPSNFGDTLSLIVFNEHGEENLLVPVERNQTGASFQVPPHPSLLSSGGQVTMTLVDDKDNECGPFSYTIHALPEAPGSYKELARLLGELGREQARVLGIDLSQLADTEKLSNDPFSEVLYLINEIVQGDKNANSIQRIAENESAAVGELSEETWEVIDGLVKQSGIVNAIQLHISELKKTDAITTNMVTTNAVTTHAITTNMVTTNASALYNPTSNKGLVTISSIKEIPLTCSTGWHRPDAAMLNDLMNMQIKNEIFGADMTLLDASGQLFGAAGVLAAAGGLPEGTGAAGATGMVILGMKLQYEALEGLLPSEFIRIQVNADPDRFLEDDEELIGTWDQAYVTAQSRGWSPDKIAFEFLLDKLGGRVSDGMIKNYDLNIFEGTRATWDMINGMLGGAATNELYGQEVDRTGLAEAPPCEFGPTDITDEQWSESRIANKEEAPIFLVDHQTYQARNTGEAILEVAPRSDRFGRRAFNPNGTFFFKDIPIPVLPIEVEVTPEQHIVEPGAKVVYKATVKNANDKGVAWEIHPVGAHQFFVDTDSDGTSLLTVHTSTDEADFPVNISAISTSSKGLRAPLDAPERAGHALLRSNKVEVEISPVTCCIEPGESETFTATIHGFTNQKVVWSVSEGTITQDGVFTAPANYPQAPVIVTATSVEESMIKGEAKVLVRDCYCYNDISIGGRNLLGESTYITRAGDDFDGALQSMTFIFETDSDDSSNSVTVDLIGEGPNPGQTGSYKVEVNGSLFDAGLSSFVAREHQMVMFGSTVPWEMFVDGKYVVLDVPPYATLMIEEFEQGPEAHMAMIKGALQGEVLVLQHNSDETIGSNPVRLAIDLTFTGHYNKILNHEIINCYGDGW